MQKFKLSPALAGAAALAIAGVIALPAHASLILVGPTGQPVNPATNVAASFTDLGAQGFGAAPRLLTLQGQGNANIETGSATPVDIANGDAQPGANKTTTPTISTLGWTSGGKVGIGFNTNENATGLTMQSLTLTIFNGTTPVSCPTCTGGVGVFNLAASLTPLQFNAVDLALQSGNGNAVFNFGLNGVEQAQFNTIVAQAGSSGFRAGLASSLGCATPVPTGCQVIDDGADSFIGFAQVPSPLIGHGFLALLAIGGVLFGGKLLESLKKHRLHAA